MIDKKLLFKADLKSMNNLNSHLSGESLKTKILFINRPYL
jgi:hypothetical protein